MTRWRCLGLSHPLTGMCATEDHVCAKCNSQGGWTESDPKADPIMVCECGREFHFRCHVPPIPKDSEPSEEMRCQECRAVQLLEAQLLDFYIGNEAHNCGFELSEVHTPDGSRKAPNALVIRIANGTATSNTIRVPLHTRHKALQTLQAQAQQRGAGEAQVNLADPGRKKASSLMDVTLRMALEGRGWMCEEKPRPDGFPFLVWRLEELNLRRNSTAKAYRCMPVHLRPPLPSWYDMSRLQRDQSPPAQAAHAPVQADPSSAALQAISDNEDSVHHTNEGDDHDCECPCCADTYDLAAHLPLLIKGCGHSVCTSCALGI